MEYSQSTRSAFCRRLLGCAVAAVFVSGAEHVRADGQTPVVVQGAGPAAQPVPVPVVAEDAPSTDDASGDGRTGFGVFVRDSAVANEKVRLAERMAISHQWNTAVEAYQDVLDRFGDRVIAAATDAQGRTLRYASAVRLVQDRLSHWPQEGRAAYIAHYGPAAQSMLDQVKGDDVDALSQVVARYFITDAGRDACLRLVAYHFERAEFAAAGLLGERLLDEHPSLGDAKPLLAARTALCWRLAGEPQRAAARAAKLRAESPNATADLGGQKVRLADWVDAQLREPLSTPSADEASRWAMAFGSPARDRLPRDAHNAADRAIAPICTIPLASAGTLPATITIPNDPNQQVAGVPAEDLVKQRAASTGIQPVIDGDELFFQDNTSVYAVSLRTGQPLPGWLAAQGESAKGRYTFGNGTAMAVDAQLGLALTDHELIAILGQPQPNPQQYQMPVSDDSARVVSLDRKNGKQLWTSNLSEVKVEHDASDDAAQNNNPAAIRRNPRFGNRGGNADTLVGACPIGTPIVVHDAVYVVVRSARGMQFEDIYLVCLNLDDGKPRWARHLVSGNSGMSSWQYGVIRLAPPASHLAYSDGRVFVSTDSGALACIDAIDGAVVWLSVYPRPLQTIDVRQMAMQGETGPDPKPAFTGNPVIVRDGRVYSLPADARTLFVHDANSGEELGRLPLRDLDDADVFVGVGPSKKGAIPNAILCGGRMIYSVDLARVIEKHASPTDAIAWKHLQATEQSRSDQTILGRPFLTDAAVYLPTSFALRRYALSDGTLLDSYPSRGVTWRENEGPGNVVALEETLVVAGPERVTVYTDPDVLRKRMEVAMAAAPSDPLPRLHYAESLFMSGLYDEAVQRIDEAIDLAGGPATMRPGEQRTAVYSTALNLSRRLRDDKPIGVDAPLVRHYFDRAGAAAQTPGQCLAVTLARVHFERDQRGSANSPATPAAGDSYSAELALWQSVLADPQQRELSIVADGNEALAREVAQRRIAELLRTRGPKLLEPLEKEAADALAKARSSPGTDAEALLEVASRYPNSSVSVTALGDATDVLRKNAQSPALRGVLLRQLSAGTSDAANASRLLEMLAREYLASKDPDMALGRLRVAMTLAKGNGAAALSSPLQIGEGSKPASTVGDAVSELEKHREARDLAGLAIASFDPKDSPNHSDVVAANHKVVLRGIESMLDSLTDERADRSVLLGTDQQLKVVEPAATAPLFSVGVPHLTGNARYAWSSDEARLAILCEDGSLATVDGKTGQLCFSLDAGKLPALAATGTSTQEAIDNDGVPIDPDSAPVAVAPTPVPTPDPNDGLDPRARLRAQQAQVQIIQRRAVAGRVVFVRNGPGQRAVMLNDAPPPVEGMPADPKADAKSVETFTRLVWAAKGDRLFATTSYGRVVALEPASGKVLWQSAPTDRAPASFDVAGDFVVLSTSDDNSSRLVVLSSLDGATVASNRFTGGLPNHISNVRLTPEGIALVMLGNELLAYDLATAPGRPLWRVGVPSLNNGLTFGESKDPSNLVVRGDRVVAVCDAKSKQQLLRVFSLMDGKPVSVANGSSRPGDLIWATGAGESAVRLSIVGSRLYVMGPSSLQSHDLDNPHLPAWSRAPDEKSLAGANVTELPAMVFPSTKSLMMLDIPATGHDTLTLRFYSRQRLANGAESGLLQGTLDIPFPNANSHSALQIVNGGLCYTGNNQELVFLPAAGK